MSNAVKEIYEFGPFRLDATELVLLRDGLPVALAPKVLETLCVLVKRSGHVVTKQELMQELWADTFVEESNLTQNIFTLRKTLGEDGSGAKYIETVPRRGYRFAADVRAVAQEEDIELSLRSRTRTRVVTESEVSNKVTEWAGARDDAEGAMVPQKIAAPLVAQKRPDEARSFSRRMLFPGLAVSILLSIAGVFLLPRLFNRAQITPPAAPSPTLEIKRLTSDSKAFDPAISPDGKDVAYRLRDNEKESVWLKNIATGSALQVMPPIANEYAGLAFSPDGNHLFYRTLRKGVPNGVVCRVPVFGGTPQDVAKDVWSYFSLSPDGKQVAFLRLDRLLIASVEGGGERELMRGSRSEWWFNVWGLTPSWSSDGQKLAICAFKRDRAGDYGCLLEVQINDATVREIAAPRWQQTLQVAWLADGKGLIVAAKDVDGAPYQVWHLSYPGGEARRLTNDLNSYTTVRLTADSRLLVAQQDMPVTHIWVLPDGDASRARQLTFGTNDTDGLYGLDWMPDGRISFVSNRSGKYDIWAMDADGGNLKQLTTNAGGWNREPKVSPDGRHIAFVSNRDGKYHIWRMNADGSDPVQLSNGEQDSWPCFSPDGLWVYYVDHTPEPIALRKVSVDGGESFPVPNKSYSFSPVVSPDGKLIAYAHYNEASGWRTGILPIDGGEPLKLFEFIAFGGYVHWTADSQAIIYIKHRETVDNLWKQPLNGGQQQQITDFKKDRISSFAYSRDGKNLVLARGYHYSDIILISNFK